jgi:hypothetical protein
MAKAQTEGGPDSGADASDESDTSDVEDVDFEEVK